MTAADIQNVLYRELSSRGHEPIVPNTTVLGFEADLLSVTKAGYTNEFEIKISRSDYKADFKKGSKHRALADPVGSRYFSGYLRCPSYFWYVTPPALLDGLDLPEYAGHIEIRTRPDGFHVPFTVKRAPRLHAVKLHPNQLRHMVRGLMFRYWDARLKEATAA